jgi:hypothetical protein
MLVVPGAVRSNMGKNNLDHLDLNSLKVLLIWERLQAPSQPCLSHDFFIVYFIMHFIMIK